MMHHLSIDKLDRNMMADSIEKVLLVLSANLEISERFQGMEHIDYSLVSLLHSDFSPVD